MSDAAPALRVAIVGSGPAALYVAAELAAAAPASSVNMIERLPTLGGLARAGVAPDHYERRRVIEAYERLARRTGRFRFFGNVEVGRHISHAELLAHHDAVIYATGAFAPRQLNLPGESLPGCFNSRDWVAWYNGHPDFANLPVRLDEERAVVVGNGNVALDIARILLLDAQALAQSDLAPEIRPRFARSAIREVRVLGRRGPAQAAFSFTELEALGRMPQVQVCVDRQQIDDADWPATDFAANLKRHCLLHYADSVHDSGKKRLILDFGVEPVECLGHSRLQEVRLRRRPIGGARADGADDMNPQTETVPAGLLIQAVGFRGQRLSGLPFDESSATIPHAAGRVLSAPGRRPLPGVYVCGWIKRGPRGPIGSNKPCAQETVHALLADARAGGLPVPETRAGDFIALLAERQPDLVDDRGWNAIDQHERRSAADRGPRTKLSRLETLLQVARHGQSPANPPAA